MSAPFISRSQAGQDKWVKAILVDGMGHTVGTYLDIGACEPENISNTYALEQIGWRGVLCDINPDSATLCKAARPDAHFVLGDATALEPAFWHQLLAARFGNVMDYLSLDIDQSTADALAIVLGSGIRFCLCTIEHDAYRFGPGPRGRIRGMMDRAGYELICGNVMHEGMVFEDWYCKPELVDMAIAAKYLCDSKDGSSIA